MASLHSVSALLRPDKLTDRIKRSTTKYHKSKSTYFEGDDPFTQLPKPFIACINFIEENGLDSEGILRCSGRVIESKAITALLEKGGNLGHVDVNAVASTLKAFLSDSPSSLLPQDRYISFIKLAEEDKPENVILLRELIVNMPLSNQRVLHRLMIFLHRVIEHSAQNKMSAQSLAIILGPIILRTTEKQNASQQFADNSSLIRLMEKLINNAETLFQGIGLNTPISLKKSVPRDGSQAAHKDHLKDRLKMRFVLQFCLHCEPAIQGTQSLFVKWSRGIAAGGGTTEQILSTDPSDLRWEDATVFECSVMYIKKTKLFEEKNISLSVKEITEKGTKTLGSTWCNLADFLEGMDVSTNVSKLVSMTYDLTSKYRKGLKLIVSAQSEIFKVNSKIIMKGGSFFTDNGEDGSDSFGSSEGSISAEDDEFFDPPSDDSYLDRPSLQRVPSSTFKRGGKQQQSLVPRERYSTLPMPRHKPGAAAVYDPILTDSVVISSPSSGVGIRTSNNNDVVEKMSQMLFEKEKLIEQLRKQLEEISRQATQPASSIAENEIFALRCDLLLNEVYNPPTLSYTYGIHGCYTSSASKIIDNISKTGVLSGASPEKIKIIERVCSSLHESYKQADTLPKSMYWFSTACELLHYIYDKVYENQNNSGDLFSFGARAFGEKIVQKAGFEGAYLFLCRVHQLAKEAYENIFHLLCKQIEPLLMNIFYGRGSNAAIRVKNLKHSPEPGTDIAVLKSILNNLIDLLLEHKIFPLLAGDMILQILEFVDESTFNVTLLQKKLFSSDGVRIKIASLQIEQWLKESHAEIWLSRRNVTVLKNIQEIANLIMVDKEKLDSVDFIRSNFKYLNLKQVLLVVEIFVQDENSKKTSPASVIKHLSGVLKTSSDKHSPVQLQGALQWHLKNSV